MPLPHPLIFLNIDTLESGRLDASSNPLKEVNVGKLLHLVHISLCSDHFFVVEQDPGLASTFLCGNGFAYECHVVSVQITGS